MIDPVEYFQRRTAQCAERLLKTLSHVPDERLDYVPAEGAKSALRLAAHCARSNEAFARILRGESFPTGSMEEIFAAMEASERSITTREEAARLLKESTEAVRAALGTLTPERIASTVETPFLTAPMLFYMDLPSRHMDNHAAQIDFLQTCWGDQTFHV